MKIMIVALFALLFLFIAYSFADLPDFPGFFPGGPNSAWVYAVAGDVVNSVKSSIKINGVEYTQIKEDGRMISILNESSFDPWGLFATATTNPFLVFRVANDGSIYGYSKPYTDAIISEVKSSYEGIKDISFSMGRDEMLLCPAPTPIAGTDLKYIQGWNVLKIKVVYSNGRLPDTLTLTGSFSFRTEMEYPKYLQRESVKGKFWVITYASAMGENPDIGEFLVRNPDKGRDGPLWEIYVDDKGIVAIMTPYTKGILARERVSASLTPEPGKGKDIPPAGTKTATWGAIKASR